MISESDLRHRPAQYLKWTAGPPSNSETVIFHFNAITNCEFKVGLPAILELLVLMVHWHAGWSSFVLSATANHSHIFDFV